jgi:hypothetical protein
MSPQPVKPADWNDAYVWPQPDDIPEPTPEEFIVTGTQEVDGHKPGEIFTAYIEPDRRAMLVEFGHLGVRPVGEDERTVEELKDAARDLKIKGFSTLSKEELATAVDEAQAAAIALEAEQTQQVPQSQQSQPKPSAPPGDKE